MFNFFRKKNTPEPEPELESEPELDQPDGQSNIAELNFVVDINGDTWVECKWDTSLDVSAHMHFAKMLDDVSVGKMMDAALEFVREEADKEGQLVEYQAILNYLSQSHQERLSSMFTDMVKDMTDTSTSMKDTLVVNPSDVLNRGNPHE